MATRLDWKHQVLKITYIWNRFQFKMLFVCYDIIKYNTKRYYLFAELPITWYHLTYCFDEVD